MNNQQEQKAVAFQALHQRAGAFVIPNPWDIGTARILAGLGFEALATTSAGVAFSLGRRDNENAISREEALAQVKVIVDATDLPVSADLENGYGDDPEAMAETIRLAAATGIVGGSSRMPPATATPLSMNLVTPWNGSRLRLPPRGLWIFRLC